MLTSLASVGIAHRLEQTDIYYPTRHLVDGVPIADLAASDRLRIALDLIIDVDEHARVYRLYCDIDNRAIAEIGNPLEWMKRMPLFVALVRELPAKRSPLRALADHAGIVTFPAALAIIGDAARLSRPGVAVAA